MNSDLSHSRIDEKLVKYTRCEVCEVEPEIDHISAHNLSENNPIADTDSLTERQSRNGQTVIPVTNPAYHSPLRPRAEYDKKAHSLVDCRSTPSASLSASDSTSKINAYEIRKREESYNMARDYLPMLKTRSSETMTSREIRKRRRREINSRFRQSQKSFRDRLETSTISSEYHECRWTFVFDPSGRLIYWWSSVVSLAFLYNFWVIIYRFAFDEINEKNIVVWFILDYTADLIYVFDIALHFRTGYLDEGVLQTDSTKLRLHYMNTTTFYVDCLCLLPLDFLYLSIGFHSIVRGFRLVKVYRFWAFLDRTERHTNFPNVVRTVSLLHYLIALFHWNACVLYLVVNNAKPWEFPKKNNVYIQYLHAMYWSITCLTNLGGLPSPTSAKDYIFLIFEMLFGLLIFATALGHIAAIVASVGLARKEFQARLDSVKTYMNLRCVPLILQDRVIRWFDYLWISNKSADEERMLKLLPDRLKAEIAIHVHLDTLQRVEIFQNTESGFLCELVLRLKPVLFSPGDYVCRKGEIGKDMYIVNRGCLHVVADHGKTMLATLKAGSYFGEISVLNMGTAGNRRTASVRSVGYSDLFRLTKQDLWDVLKEYPAARVRLEAIAVKRLERYKKAPIEKIRMSRSKSTPGLVESFGKTSVYAPLYAAIEETNQHCDNDSSIKERREENNKHPFKITSSEPSLLVTEDDTRNQSETVKNTIAGIFESQNKTEDISRDSQCASRNQRTFPSLTFTNDHSHIENHENNNTDDSEELFLRKKQNGFRRHIPLVSLSPSPGYHTLTPDQSLCSPYHSPSFYSPSPSAFLLTPQRSPKLISPNHLMAPQVNHAFTFLRPSSQPNYNPQVYLSDEYSDDIVNSIPTVSSNIKQDLSSELLQQEICRLRERLACLETENASMSVKLKKQQWEVDNRLTEIEMQICSSDNETESRRYSIEYQNKESVI